MKGASMAQSDAHHASPASRAARATQEHLAQFGDEDLAYHEAGHAVVHHLEGGAVTRLSIERTDPRRGTQLAPGAAPPSGSASSDPEALRKRIATLVGGEVAATLHGTPEHVVTAGGRVDHDQALRAAAEAGIAPDDARAMIDAEWQRVRDLLSEPARWRLVESLAQAVLRDRTLDAGQIRAVLVR
jgi:hypothetical protein